MKTNIAVIGGGAAGFFAAIKCAEDAPGRSVTLYEKGAHVLTKVRISGGGRCNVTHSCFIPKVLIQNYPRGGQALLGPFHKFQPSDTVKWFEQRGVPLKTEEDGRIFPVTDTSVTIINALKDAAKAANVTVKTYAGPVSVARENSKTFRLTLPSGDWDICDRLLLATGSAEQGYEWAKGFGHTIVPPVPSLFTFAVPDERLRGLAGISVEKGEVGIVGTRLKQTGPVLITHWGLSGPAVLKLSAWGARVLHEVDYRGQIEINWSGIDRKKVFDIFQNFKKENPRKSVSVNSPLPIPHRLWEMLVRSASIPESHGWADISNVEMERLSVALCSSTYAIRGKSTFKEEFVTAGGVDLDEVDFRTMESRKCPGLYFAGEILDVDGVTGGFNFQNAWTTGWLAGRAMAEI